MPTPRNPFTTEHLRMRRKRGKITSFAPPRKEGASFARSVGDNSSQ